MHTLGSRLREERERLRLSQSAFADRCGVKKTSQINYEADRRGPDAAYLQLATELGVDVLYVLTGNRSRFAAPDAAHITPHDSATILSTGGNALVLTADEAALLDNYRHSSEAGKRAVEAAAAALALPETPDSGEAKAA